MQDLQDLTTIAPRVPMPLGGLAHRAIPALLNILSAPWYRQDIANSKQQLAEYELGLQNLAQQYIAPKGPAVPSILHFVYGLKRREFFPYYAKLAVLSALHHNAGWHAYFHYREEPFGPHWDSVRPHLILNPVPDFAYFKTAPITHYAHKADIIRLLALKQMGGAYLDIDTLTQRPFAPLQQQSYVMGVQRSLPGQPGGLCNAIMFAAPHAPFLELWLKQHRHFRSRGTDWLWDFMSVKTPAKLAANHPDLITVLKPDALFEPLWTDVEQVLFSEAPSTNRPSNFAFHLWNNMIGTRLEAIDVSYLRQSNSLYAQIARPVAKAAGDI